MDIQIRNTDQGYTRDLHKHVKKLDFEKKEIVKANKKLTEYKAQLENKGYYDSVESPSPASVSAEQEQQIKRAISEAMFNEPTYFKKDGGIISIFDMIKPVNAQR